MTSFLLKRPVAVSMFYLSVVILGVISYRYMSVEALPDTELPKIVVQSNWGSTSPEVVQIFLTSPIEEAAAQVEGLEELLSSSGRGSSTVTCNFNRDTDMEFARLDLNERLSRLRSELPPGATQPRLSVSERDQNSTDRFMIFNVSGPYDLQRLTEIFTDYLRDEITAVDGVADISVFGERRKTLRIRLNREAMELSRVGEYDRAIVLAERAHELAEETRGPDHPEVAASLNNLASLYKVKGRYSEAEPLFLRSLAIAEQAPGLPVVQ